MGKLQGKVAFVSGGSQGIGEQTALLFGREGASVAVIASSEFAKAEHRDNHADFRDIARENPDLVQPA
jgi:NAD(P)-dependent dehydrogenase (short-subunit alcohol dehydrogenase family)